MPELPDVTVYVERLAALTVGRVLQGVRMRSPFVLRTVDPPPAAAVGHPVKSVIRLGKRIVLTVGDASARAVAKQSEPALGPASAAERRGNPPDSLPFSAAEVCLVIHLMIAGRLRWRPPGAPITGKDTLLALDFEHGTLLFTEASQKKRASLHVILPADLPQFDRGGHEVSASDRAGFHQALTRENRTVKRALTDPRLFSGIGNAYSDEILFAAQLSPVRLTSKLTEDEVTRLHTATVSVLATFTERLRAEVGEGFPEKVTAFREDMAVHGRFGQPCRVCDQPIQRIRYADNETNYCARCQNADRLLADRSLSLLLKKDWPKTLDDL